jgi:hypothetical protein
VPKMRKEGPPARFQKQTSKRASEDIGSER